MKLFLLDKGSPHEIRPQPEPVDDRLRPLGDVEEMKGWQAPGCSGKRRICLAASMPLGVGRR
jgi:hypothetical protein